MYLYFDVNGNLKEVIQTPVRQGSVEANKIYAFISPTTEELDGDTYKKLDEYDSAKINFELLDGGTNLNPNGGSSVPMSEITKQIPFDKNRDLKFFKYGYNYEFWTVELPSTVTNVNGVVTASIYLYNNGESNDFALNRFSFNVEASVGVKPDSTMSESQYSYLYNRYHDLEGQFIPYSGATNDINLGTHELTANKVNVGNLTIEQTGNNSFEIGANYQDTLNLSFAEVDINGNKVLTEDDDVISSSELETILSDYATKDWVQGQSYVTYTATDDLDLGDNELKFTVNQNQGRMYYDGNDLYILTSDGDIILKPDGVAKYGSSEIATKNDLSGFLKYNENIDLGTYGFKAYDIEAPNGVYVGSVQGYKLDISADEGDVYPYFYIHNGNSYLGKINLPTVSNNATVTLATQGYVDARAHKPLYKHYISISQLATSYVMYIVVYSYNDTAIDSADTLLTIYGGLNYDRNEPFTMEDNNGNLTIGISSKIVQDNNTSYAMQVLILNNGAFTTDSFDISYIDDYVEEVQ